MCVCVCARWDRGQSVMSVFAKSARDAEMMDRQKEGGDGEGAEREVHNRRELCTSSTQ